jgi:hypothetical protein
MCAGVVKKANNLSIFEISNLNYNPVGGEIISTSMNPFCQVRMNGR